MWLDVLLFGLLITSFMLVVAKRISALINYFTLQSLALFLLMLILAYGHAGVKLYLVAGLIFLLKVVLIPFFLKRIMRKIKVEENVGFFVNPVISVLIALVLVYLSYAFTTKLLHITETLAQGAFSVAISIIFIGMFLMISRIKALVQIVGLLVMENGLFLAAISVSGGMPFLVEVVIFFDILVSVVILELFVYKINNAFEHIDSNKLKGLQG